MSIKIHKHASDGQTDIEAYIKHGPMLSPSECYVRSHKLKIPFSTSGIVYN